MRPALDRPVVFIGINGEGLGHATRSLPVIEALSRHHEVQVFCGGRAYGFLKDRVPNLRRVWCGRLNVANNRTRVWATVLDCLLGAPRMLWCGAMVTVLACWRRPLAMITDFEPLTAWAGMLSGTTVVSLDNQGVLRHARLPCVTGVSRGEYWLARLVAFLQQPRVQVALVTSMFRFPLRRARAADVDVRYLPVAVRPQVLAWKGRTRTDGPVLVYQSTPSNEALQDTLEQASQRTGLRFVVYGTRQGGEDDAGQVQFRRFDEQRFLADLAAAPFVIVNGGHSTLSECLALGKPVLAEPLHNHFEQALNAHALQACGAGRWTQRLSVNDIAAFTVELPWLTSATAAAARLVQPDGVCGAVLQLLETLQEGRAVAA